MNKETLHCINWVSKKSEKECYEFHKIGFKTGNVSLVINHDENFVDWKIDIDSQLKDLRKQIFDYEIALKEIDNIVIERKLRATIAGMQEFKEFLEKIQKLEQEFKNGKKQY